jgi:predicted phage terminase large subunit-like protein
MLRATRAERARRSTERETRRRLQEVRRDANAVRVRCKRLSQFVREAWPHVPELSHVTYVHGWHIDLLCEHLEAVTWGRLLDLGYENRVLFNIPPGMMKSLLVSVFWPAWEWANGFAHYQYIATSFRVDYCRRDTRRMRDLVMSEWYQGLYGDDRIEGTGKAARKIPGVRLVAKGSSRISNTAGGWREGIPFESLTGGRADRLLIDDPQSNKTGESEPFQDRDERTFREVVPKRVNDPVKSAIIVIQQRISQRDTSAVIEKYSLPYLRVVLPMRFEPNRACATPIGRDRRTQEGELLFPERFPEETVDRDEDGMTQYAIDSQHQQNPSGREGSLFKRPWFARRVRAAPARARRARGWDLAGSVKKRAKYTAGVRMSIGPDGTVYVEHAVRDRLSPADVNKTIKAVALADDAVVPGRPVRISIPQDPGQAGLAQVHGFAKLLQGHDVRFSTESGEKTDRALPLAAQAEIGNVAIVETGNQAADAWIEPFIDELVKFQKNAEFTDQGDAASRAYAALLALPPVEDDLFVLSIKE